MKKPAKKQTGKTTKLVKKQTGGDWIPFTMTSSPSSYVETSSKKPEKKLKAKVKDVVSNIKSKIRKSKPSSHTNVRFLWD